mgnify:CR=1 FL=1
MSKDKEIEELARELTRIAMSPIYDDDKVLEANQDTFRQHMQSMNAEVIASHIHKLILEARIRDLKWCYDFLGKCTTGEFVEKRITELTAQLKEQP